MNYIHIHSYYIALSHVYHGNKNLPKAIGYYTYLLDNLTSDSNKCNNFSVWCDIN